MLITLIILYQNIIFHRKDIFTEEKNFFMCMVFHRENG